MPIIVTLLTAIVLIPAGVAGISVGTSELLGAGGELVTRVDQALSGLAPLLPYAQPVLFLVGGFGLVMLATALILRGLQSRI
ncbi:MAG: hypothetical protein ACNA7J_00850 [Wenzhouxiangella sp.]